MTYTVPTTSIKRLRALIEKRNKQNDNLKLSLEYAFKIYNSIIEIIQYNRRNGRTGAITIHSDSLIKFYSRYYIYTKFLVKHNFLHLVNYNKDKGRPNAYDLHYQYYDDTFSTVSFNIKKETFNSKYINYVSKDLKPYLFLIKNFENLCFETEKALTFSNDLYDKRKISKEQLISYKYRITKLDKHLFDFKKPATDRRFHSTLTNTPKSLRKFIKYNKKCLYNLDLKNSQPFFFAVILNIIINKDYVTLKRLKSKISKVRSKKANKSYNYYKIIYPLLKKEFSQAEKKEIENYIKSACNGKFYELLAENLEFNYGSNGDIYKSQYSTEKKTRVIKYFNKHDENSKNKRDYAKNAAFQVFFASANSRDLDATRIKNMFPAIWNITVILKGKQSSNFAVLLQNIESYIVLDICASSIHKKIYAPILTIHDSIATTKEYLLKSKNIMIEEILNLVKIVPTIEIEPWI